MKTYLSDVAEVFKSVNAEPIGLSSEEALKRTAEKGENKLKEAKKTSLIVRFLKQLADPMIIILLAAALVSGITAIIGHESFADVIIILIVVLLNAILGVVQESKAEKAIEALQEMTAATSKVLRNGKREIVKSRELTVGDVILLEAGDAVPADARIFECASLKVEEAALTGESVPSLKQTAKLSLDGQKDISLGDRKNMVYMGSTVVYGRASAVITDIGMQTEMGKIAQALSLTKEEATPLQQKLSQLSKVLSIAVLGICVFIFAFSLITAGKINGQVFLSTFMIAVSLAVAAIPEGLATVVTIVLSIGVTRMSKRNAVIRKLTAVETLGCAQVICSDKTGTLTQNKMTVTQYYGSDLNLLCKAMALCNDADLDENNQAKGEPTEAALVNYSYKNGVNRTLLKQEEMRVGEAPFDSSRKMMTTVHALKNGYIQYTKGAPDELLKRCKYALVDGKEILLDEKVKNDILTANKNMADNALRVLAAAYKRYPNIPADFDATALEKELVFVGLNGMIDPVRPEVKIAIDECKDAGINVVMITGDHLDTATAIAKELGIISDRSQAITGSMLDDVSDANLPGLIKDIHVYARVQPEHKVRIVNAWKELGKITAMTGDGVNDAPSIKAANIGVGMGITGTDVTKNVADMVLADDNFATIVSAVEEGRRIYDNVRKAIQFLLSSNLSEVVSIFIATLFGFTILKPVHLLWINLITDTFPALALGIEPAENNLMKRKPRDSKEGIFANGMGFNVIYQGVLVAIITLMAYLIGHYLESGKWEFVNSPDGMTMAFLAMSMAEVFHAFNMRSQQGSIFTLKKQNVPLWLAMVCSLLLTTAVIYIRPLALAFGFEEINFIEYITALALAISVIPIVELVKLIQRLCTAKKQR
ncbi:MAG: cation-translocating P-type ATPase [Clostridia bacterium]